MTGSDTPRANFDMTGILREMSAARAAGKTPFIRVTTDVEPGPASASPFGPAHVDVMVHPTVWEELVGDLPDTSPGLDGAGWVGTQVVFGGRPPRCFREEFRPGLCDVIATKDPDGTGEPYLCVSCAKDVGA